MVNGEQEKQRQAQNIRLQNLADLDGFFSSPAELSRTITNVTDILDMVNGLVSVAEKAAIDAAATSTFEDDLDVIELQIEALEKLEQKIKSIPETGEITQNVKNQIFSLARARFRLIIASHHAEQSEVTQRAGRQAITRINELSTNIKTSTPTAEQVVTGLANFAQQNATDSKVLEKKEPVVKGLSNNLIIAVREISVTDFDEEDLDQMKSWTKLLRDCAARVLTVKDGKNSTLTVEEIRKIEEILGNISDKHTQYFYLANDSAVTQLQKIEAIAHEILHENRVAVVGGPKDENRELLRPGRTIAETGPGIDAFVDTFVRRFASDFDHAEKKIGVVLATTPEADLAGKISEDDVVFLKNLREKVADFHDRQDLMMTHSFSLSANSPVGIENNLLVKQVDSYLDKHESWLGKLIKESEKVVDAIKAAEKIALAKAEADRKQAEADALAESKNLTFKGDLLAQDVEKITTEDRLFAYGKQLLKILNDDASTYSSPGNQAKRDYRRKLTEVQNKLNSEFGDSGARRASYLQARLEIGTATFWAGNSGYAMNYEKILSGGDGWPGASVTGEFNEKHILRLLEGPDFDFDSLEKKNEPEYREEKERTETVRKVLENACDLFGQADASGITVDASGNIRGKLKLGDFHATQEFSSNHKSLFEKEIQDRVFGKGTVLTEDQNDAFKLGLEMMTFLDLRTYYVLPFLGMGWSPPADSIGTTVGETAKLCNPLLQNAYIIAGKFDGYVNYYNTVQNFSDLALATADSDAKREAIEFSQLATSAWWGLYAEPLTDPLYELPFGVNPIPTLAEAFYRPKRPAWVNEVRAKMGKPRLQGDCDVPDRTYNAIKKTAIGADKSGISGRTVPLLALLTGILKEKEFLATVEKASPISSDIHASTDKIRALFTELSKKFSPTKALPTIDVRFAANMIVNYIRQTLLLYTFNEYHLIAEGKSNKYWSGLAEIVETIESSLDAPTLSTEIPKEYLDYSPGLVAKYHMHTTSNGGVTVSDYVRAFMPEAEKNFFIGARLTGHYPEVVKSVQSSPERVKNTLDIVAKLKGEFTIDVYNKLVAVIRGGGASRYVVPFTGNDKASRMKWTAVKFPELAAEKAQTK